MTDQEPIDAGRPNEYRPGKGPYFSKVPMDLLEHESHDAYVLAVYAAIYAVAFFQKFNSGVATDEELGELAGCSGRQVRRSRTWLREQGWIDWQERVGYPNMYRIHMTPDSQAAATQAEARQADGSDSQAGGPASQAEGVGHTGRPSMDREEKETKEEGKLEEKPKEIPREGPELPTLSCDVRELKEAWAWALEKAPKYPNMLVRLKLTRGLLLDFKVEKLGESLGDKPIPGYKFNPEQLIVARVLAWRPLTDELVELVKKNAISGVLKKWATEVNVIEEKLIRPNARLRDFKKKHPSGYPFTSILYSRRAVPANALQPLALEEELSGATVE